MGLVLVACEESQTVCKAFRDRGHEAYSCDILTPSGGFPEWHFQCDVRDLLDVPWDMMIAHPPCTYLANSGVQHLHKEFGRWNFLAKAHSFFMLLLNSDIPLLCIENPVPHKYAKLPKYTQIIEPWQFGNNVTKRTCLWLKNLPKLKPTKIVDKGSRYIDKNGKSNGAAWYQLLPPGKNRTKIRSKTFPGIANAMAEQWGKLV
jgi:hypothetical protein